MAFPFLNQVYAGLKGPNDATVNQWIANTQAPPPAAPSMGPPAGTIIMPGQPVNVNAPVFAGIPAQFQAKAAPLPMPAAPPQIPPPQAQMAATGTQAGLPPDPQMQDTTVQVRYAPMQMMSTPVAGHAAGNLNTMTPEQEQLYTKAAGTIGNAETGAAERVATAMVAQQAPLDERAQYLAALAEREAQDQTGRNEQNRQRQEDYETEAKKLQGMSVDPNRRMKSGEGILDALGIIFGGIGQGYLRRAGDMNAQNVGVQMAAANKAQDIEAQHANIAQQKGYVDQVYANMRAQREQQGDQVASTQRQAQLMKEATGAHLDQAGIGVAMSEALAKGDLGQAHASASVDQQKGAKQVYIPASSGGSLIRVKKADGTWSLPMTQAQARDYEMNVDKEQRGTGNTLIVNAAKADSEGKAKDDTAKRTVPTGNGGSYLAGSAEEAKDHREARAAAATYTETLQKMQKIRNETTPHELALAKAGIKTDRIKELEALQGVATGQFNKMNKFGALDNGTVDLINRTMGNATDFANPTARYKSLIDGVNADLESKARAGQGYVRPQIQQAAPSFKPVGK